MPVIIRNVTEFGLADEAGVADYTVHVNSDLIARFRHKREDGLAECLRRAADEVDRAALTKPHGGTSG